MSTYDHYATPVAPGTWDVPAAGAARFTWEYDGGRGRLLDLYQRGKDKQWDATKRIDWELPVDPSNVMGISEEFSPIYGSRQWEILSPGRTRRAGHAPVLLAVQPVPARRAGRADRGGPDRRVGAGHGLEVLRGHPGHGRGAARGAVLPVHPGQDRPALPDQHRPGAAAGRRAQRLPLGPALPGDAGADRGAGAGRVRRAPGHGHQPAGQADPRLRDAGRGAARGVRPARPARLLRRADRGRAGRPRGVRGRGLLPDAQPLPRPGGVGADGLRRGRVPGVHRELPAAAGVPRAAVQPDRAVREGHRAVGPKVSSAPSPTWASSTPPRPTWKR